MKNIIALTFGFVSLFCSYSTLFAQQNLFNVPSAEITVKKDVFFQQQFNIETEMQSNTTLTYGLGKGWEIGLNAFNLDLDNNIHKSIKNNNITQTFFSSLYLINVQKGWMILDNIHLSFGSQSGIRHYKYETYKPASFNYVNFRIDALQKRLLLVTGIYYATKTMSQTKDVFGFQAGVDLKIIKERLDFTADVISGKNNLSVAVVGMSFNITKKWVVSAGYQMPYWGSPNKTGFVIELTKI